MNERNFIFLLFCATLATGCLQPVDSSASSSSAVSGGSAAPAPCNGKQPFSLDTDPSGQTIVCPAADGGDIPVALAPFPVFLDGGATSTNPCDLLGERSHAIREAYCAPCHNPPQSMGSFNFCLDDSELMTAYSQNAIDPATGKLRHMLVPGDPDNSYLYLRVAIGNMPPLGVMPRPPASDVSVLREWITSCLGGHPPAAPSSGADSGTGSSSSDDVDAGHAVDSGKPPVDAGRG